ncbi:MAG: cytochrome c oxidase subunit 3 [Myxococcales bacterium]|nr:cytochrome c oxidase subunit 3 [Myxococcales bacterium]MBK7192491.1 cytochrome c oxidase subunit 3 [Myxococcales bacterium]MBP6846299.1 cytochrome c oxidase subunit 3 [Kofleriaceae bacterium]
MTTPAPSRPLSDPPGGVLMWLIVTIELVTFAIIGGALAYLRRDQPAVFHAGQAALSPIVGLGYTLLLVTSGWLAAEAVAALRRERRARARGLLLAAIAFGLGFVGLKLHDGAGLIAAGHDLGSDDFWTGYFFATGFHLVHVAVGVLLLAVGAARTRRGDADDAEVVEALVLFWHMCDVAWFILLAVLYTGA